MRFGGGGFALIWVVIVGFIVFVWWRIFRKAGYPGWVGLLMVVPLANFIALLYFAFSEWPVERAARANLATPPIGDAPPVT